MKFEDFKRKVRLKNVVISRLDKLIEDGYSSDAITKTRDKLQNCSQHTVIGKCKDCGTKYFAGSNSCNNRFCPVCAKKRCLKYLNILLPAFQRYLDRGCTVHLLTFTIKNTKNFMDGLDKILQAFRYMTNGNKFYSRVFNYLFVGGIKSLEVIRGITDEETYHPHLHLLVIKDKFTRDFAILKEIWNNSVNVVYGTQNEKLGSVHITQVKSKEFKKSKKQDIKDVKAGILEAIKYITKVEDIFDYENQMLSDFITYSNKRRYISVFGGLAKLAKAMQEDITETTKDLVGKVCKHCGCTEFEFLTDFTAHCGPLEDFEYAEQ